MSDVKVTDSVLYVGCDDLDIDLFESQYHVPNGVSYNSYVILDEKIAIMDTVDPRRTEEWMEKVEKALGGRLPDYLVVQHMEPDHAGSIQKICTKYPQMQIVSNAKVFGMMPQFFDFDLTGRTITVKEGDTLSLGSHTLTFVMAPMVHWPEVMVTYEASEKILFSADGFGKFGALSVEEDWTDEARRYFINIVGKYGGPVQTLLKKASALDIQMICPLHGPILKDNLSYYIDKYQIWSRYESEDEGVFVACASIHGNTKDVALKVVEMLKAKGIKVAFADLTRDDMSEAIEDAFRYDKLILAASSYDAGVFPPMEDFLNRLSHKTYQNRKVGIIENGSWAPSAAKTMKGIVETFKNVAICEQTVTIKSTMKDADVEAIEKLAEEILG